MTCRLFAVKQMAGKPRVKQPKVEAFGRLLQTLRKQVQNPRGDATPLSADAIARLVRAVGPHLSLVGSTLWRWEEGEVTSPDPLILRELARIYQTSFPNLLSVLDANRSNPALDDKEAFRILEDTPDAGQQPSTQDRHLKPITEHVVEAASILIDIGDQIHRVAESLLARHAANLGLTSAEQPPHHRAARGTARPAGVKGTGRRRVKNGG